MRRRRWEPARWVAELQEIEPLAWNAQAVVSSYERARGLRAVGEHPEGFAVTVSRTIAVPGGRLYEAFVEESVREGWLPVARMRERTATKSRSGGTRAGADLPETQRDQFLDDRLR